MSDYSVPPVTRAIRVLQHIAAGNSCSTISQTSKVLGINRTTLHRLLATLEQEGMIEAASEAGGYVLGTELINLAARSLFSRDIVQVAQPILKRLASDLGLAAHLGVVDGRGVLYLARETPNLHLVSNVRVGSRLPLHATSIGRIVLAFWPTEKVIQTMSGRELGAATDKTATTMESLLEQIAEDRAERIAWSVGNFERGVGSAAAAVFDSSGEVAGAINVTGPESEFDPRGDKRAKISHGILRAAEEISRQLGYSPKEKPISK